MAEHRVCSHCGAGLKRCAGKWVCPSCLLQGGLADEGERLSAKEASASVTFSPLPRAFGEYELLEVIAQGGMGVVYRARQKSLNRIVALKMLLGGQFAQPKFIERFRAEAEAVAQLQHPNIVAIHEIGEQDGQLFFSMDYVEGKNLAQISTEFGSRSAEFRRCAAWIKTMAEAIDYAHQRGIIHRDLKPSNVLIDPFDQPRITDFGLAKRIAGDSDLTLTGQVLGSPNYLPPEQAAGNPARVESDVYALGAILYHLLTGRPPFEAESVTAVLRQVIEAEALSPRWLNPGIPRDLETISLKCLEKEPHRRYQTARELAEDVGRFLEDKPIQARPVGAVGKTWKWCRRRPALAGMGLALALTGALGLAGVLWHSRQAVKERRLSQEGGYAADMLLAQQALAENNRGHALRLLEMHRQEAQSPAQNPVAGVNGAWESRYLWQLCQGDESFTLHQYPAAIKALALSPDGNVLAVATKDQVALWDPVRKQLLTNLPNQAIPPLAFTAGGLLATATRGATGELGVGFWDVNAGRITTKLPCKPFEFDLSPDGKLPLSADGKLLAVLAKRGLAQVVEVASGRVLTSVTFPLRRSPESIAVFSPDATRLAIAEDYGRLRLLDLRTGSIVVLSPSEPGVSGINRLAFSPAGDRLAVDYSYYDENKGVICDWDLKTLKPRGEVTHHQALFVTALAFTPDGGRLISAATDWTIRIWNLTNHTQERCLWSRDVVGPVVLLSDSRTLVSGASDGSVCIWDAFAEPRPPTQTNLVVSASMRSFAEVEAAHSRPEAPDPGGVCRLGVAFTRDSRQFITTDTNGWLVLGDARSLRPLETLPAFGSNHWGMAVSPDDRWLATGDAEGKVTMWDWKKGQAMTNFALPFDHYGSLRFSRSGQYLTASVLHSDWKATVRVWRTGDWAEVPLTGDRFQRLWPIDLSPDDRLLAGGYISGAVKLFRFRFPLLQGKVLLPEQPEIVCGMRFAPDGRQLLSVGRYGSVWIWDVAAERQIAEWTNDMSRVWGSVLSPDGRRLIIGGMGAGGGTLQFWDLAVRREALSMRGEKSDFMALTFSPDGNILAATGFNGLAHLWRAPSWADIEAIERAKAVPP
ncbi:MAG: WD40 repeat domain-containing serine/threonine protein kinase [Verrucomicrobiia bacterium]